MMNRSFDARMQAFLKSSLPPIGSAGPPRDLWPDMLKRIEANAGEKIAFTPLDWAIAGLIAVSVFIFPGLIPALLYHL
jgi:hypothetical protein